MNNHDELSYIKIMTRVIEEMSKEHDKLKREVVFHRIILFILTALIVVSLILGVK